MTMYAPENVVFAVVGEHIQQGQWMSLRQSGFHHAPNALHWAESMERRADYRDLRVVASVRVDIPLDDYRQGDPLSYITPVERMIGLHPDPDWASETNHGHNTVYVTAPDQIPARYAGTVVAELRNDVSRLNSEVMGCRNLVRQGIELLGGTA